jgi:hypothetical protein
MAHGDIIRAVFAAMPDAYHEASVDGTLPAPARQVMYAVRRISGLGDRLKSPYFLGKLLDKYLDQHPDETAEWDIVRDDRGTFTEPHSGREVPLGTIAVREYLRQIHRHDGYYPHDSDRPPELSEYWPTLGPENAFGAVLYIEKEGFQHIIASEQIAERFDLAVASCKGYSVKAARRLIRDLQDRYGVPVYVVHDFDADGFGICNTLGDRFVDLGLRWDDIQDPRWGLDADTASEAVTYGKYNPIPNLRRRGATPDEIAFLAPTPKAGRRVELNALVGLRFTEWLEAKLAEHDVAKVIPDAATLETAFRWAYQRLRLNRAIAAAFEDARTEAADVEMPAELVSRVTDGLADAPARSWDAVVVDLAGDAIDDDDTGDGSP